MITRRKVPVEPGTLFRLGPLQGVAESPLGDGWWRCKLYHGNRDIWIPVREEFILWQTRIVPVIFRRQQP